jgi:pimeloyl-ACP methyl ester carboxylesterase
MDAFFWAVVRAACRRFLRTGPVVAVVTVAIMAVVQPVNATPVIPGPAVVQAPTGRLAETIVWGSATVNAAQSTKKPAKKTPKRVVRKPTATRPKAAPTPVLTVPPVDAQSSTPTPSIAPSPSTPQFASCGQNVECATVAVPRDHAQPAKASTNLHIARRKARVPEQRIGVLFVNPGGPGGPTLDLVRGAENIVRGDVLDRFDVIGVDPRGTERSTPLRCLANLADNELPNVGIIDPSDPTSDLQEIRTEYALVAKQCATSSAEQLLEMDTETAARDLDAVRELLGESSISFVGLSYGTYLGAVYTALFPSRVRVSILDSAISPERFGERMALDRVAATDLALEGFLAACASGALTPCKFNNGTNLTERYASMRAKFIARTGQTTANTVLLDQTVATLVGAPLNGWPILGRALNEVDLTGRGNFNRTAEDARTNLPSVDIVPTDTFSSLVNLAINCRDGIVPRSPDAYLSIRSQIPTVSPRFSGLVDDSAFGLICIDWPAPVKPQVPLRFASAATIVIANRYDLTTPLSWSQSLSSVMGAPLLVREGGGHIALDKSQCIRDYAAVFLITATPPPPGATCAQL